MNNQVCYTHEVYVIKKGDLKRDPLSWLQEFWVWYAQCVIPCICETLIYTLTCSMHAAIYQ